MHCIVVSALPLLLLIREICGHYSALFYGVDKIVHRYEPNERRREG